MQTLVSPDSPLQFGCCISEGNPRELVTRAVGDIGGEAVNIGWESMHHRKACGWDAVVYDLAPWDKRSQSTIRTIIEACPTAPILLYAPVRPGIGSLLCDRWPDRVGIKLQFEDPEEATRLYDQMRVLLGRIPLQHIGSIFGALFPELPNRVSTYIRLAIRELGDAGQVSPNVSSLAYSMEVSLRTLERSWAGLRIPSPKELLDWIMLLYITLAGESTCIPVGAAGRVIGLDAAAICRLRKRLVSPMIANALQNGIESTSDFDVTLLSFARRYGISADHVLEVSEHAVLKCR